jgi:hypothetical protein
VALRPRLSPGVPLSWDVEVGLTAWYEGCQATSAGGSIRVSSGHVQSRKQHARPPPLLPARLWANAKVGMRLRQRGGRAVGTSGPSWGILERCSPLLASTP